MPHAFLTAGHHEQTTIKGDIPFDLTPLLREGLLRCYRDVTLLDEVVFPLEPLKDVSGFDILAHLEHEYRSRH